MFDSAQHYLGLDYIVFYKKYEID